MKSFSRNRSDWTVQHRPMQTERRRAGEGYFDLARDPLHVLLFVLPLVVLYEVGSWLYLGRVGTGAAETIRAHSILLGFFQDFGVAGRFLPGLTLITVLIVWWLLTGGSRRVRLWVMPVIALEAAAWTIPLLILIALVQDSPPAAAMPDLLALSWQARTVISIGAGLYEELLFRMIGIAALHLVLVDLARVREPMGTALAVVATAIAFALYHDVTDAWGRVVWGQAFALLSAGAYFGVVYLARGYAVVVAVHTFYDLLVLVIFPASARGS